MNIDELGEFGLIKRIAPWFPAPPDCHQGIGDDCAVLPGRDDRLLLVTTDLLVENSHFLRDRIPPEDLGYKALAVNVSDIAAMGGTPTSAFLSLGLPAGMNVAWLDRFFEGLRMMSAEVSCPLLGGDTTKSASGIIINIAVLGEVEHDRIRYRSAARPGDVIAVTGSLGDSGAGLRLLLENKPVDDVAVRALIDAHHHPRPHVAEGRWLGAQTGVHAMMDVSDGIDSDVRRIMERSGVGAAIQLEALPVTEHFTAVCQRYAWPAAEIAATAGEDYCLLCTMDAAAFPAVAKEFQQRFHRPLAPIGVIEAGSEFHYQLNGRPAQLRRRGFDHFKE
ncbi:MAG TPA: thiamine-phosphate kinase [Kiritimatiellia bacterium]|nr:thiamine-phosphate kinase [Kiritimatiellia bacterium]HMO99503.1 thiamine-phosphate kinase [Kiritimatiellia bacterium]HMP97864.1 thiamine-phosphate kinase [Kiritimatiellia bacterium]